MAYWFNPVRLAEIEEDALKLQALFTAAADEAESERDAMRAQQLRHQAGRAGEMAQYARVEAELAQRARPA